MAVFYFTSTSYDMLAGMLIKTVNGFPQIAYPNALGITPATAGKGVSGYYYLSINLPGSNTFPDTLPDGVTEDDANGIAVLGTWL